MQQAFPARSAARRSGNSYFSIVELSIELPKTSEFADDVLANFEKLFGIV